MGMSESSPPAFPGTINDFREKHKGNEELHRRLRNKIKKCNQCGKPCAYTLEHCNGCGASLVAIEYSYNDNVFMGFVHGIASGSFPYTISLRSQSPDFLCFDDP